MCGIVGNISLGKRKLNIHNIQEIKNMLDIQNHRGPDDRGICGFSFCTGEVSELESGHDRMREQLDGILGFNRLSILDLSSKGHQPMLSEDKRVLLAFNGEIYNAFDFVKELERKGYCFHSRTDTEVVLKLYLEYGFDKMIKILNGMFALVIVDLRTKKFYMARDRFGIKPLYYSVFDDRIIFASELKCFLCDTEFKPELDKESVFEHLIYSGTYHKNLMKGVENLQSGEVLEFAEGQIKKYKFFDIDQYCRPLKGQISHRKYKEKMEDVLRRAVERQMISDVKLGCQLSGGIDSTLITTYASQRDHTGLKDTISVIFDDQNRSYSEESYMDMVQEKLHLHAHKHVIDKSYVSENLERTIWHLDTMANTSNSIGIMLLSEEAKKNVTVLLSGEGADEAFAGYWQFSLAPVLERYWKVRRNPLGRLLTKPVSHFDEGALSKYMKNGYSNFVVSTFGVTEKEYFCNMVTMEQDNASTLYESIKDSRRRLFDKFSGTSFDKHIKYMMSTNLPDLLIRQDKMSMSASIENRVPFLDNEVIDFAFSLPQKELLKWRISPQRIKDLKFTEGKNILKELSVKIYGRKFTFRGKRGFDLPLADFLSSRNFKNYFYDTLVPGMRKHGVLNARFAEELYSNINILSGKEAAVLWKMVNLEIWCQLFIDRKYDKYLLKDKGTKQNVI